MQLVINTYGSYLHRDKGCFELKTDDKKTKISTKKVDSILITTGAAVSSDAIKLALDNNIEIQFLDQHGRSVGKVWHSKLGSTTYIRRRQLEIAETEEGTRLVKELALRKVSNCIDHLCDLGIKRSEEKQNYINDLTKEMEELKAKLNKVTGLIDAVRNRLMDMKGMLVESILKV